jgi:hypothetical protein
VSIPHFVSYKSTWGNCPRLRLKNTAPYDSANFNDHPVYNIKQEKNSAQTTAPEPDIWPEAQKFPEPQLIKTVINDGPLEGKQFGPNDQL